MSIRLRLTLLYSLILATTLTVFSIVVLVVTRQSTHDMLQDTLASEMTRLMESNVHSPNYVQWPTDTLSSGETYWQACDRTGHMIDQTSNLQGNTLPLSTPGLELVQAGQPVYETTYVEDLPMMIYSQPLVESGRVTGILQVGRSTADQEQSLIVLETTLIVGSLVMFALAVGSGWVLSGAALRPMDQLTRTAGLIRAERNFERRVEYRGPPDEVGKLATTFNAMLAALQEAYQQVTEALQTQRRFVADASHELRTPLTTMRGNLALLQREPPISPQDRREVLDDIVDENQRMIRLVHDLLTLARTDSTPPVEPKPIALPSLIREIERQLNGLNRVCSFSFTMPEMVTVLGDRDMLKQVLIILLDNACKFTPPEGDIHLRISSDGHMARIQVRDTGIGIAAHDLPHIFQRFYRSDHARTGAGYGLGLAIAEVLIKKQGGTISVSSTVDVGSTFTVSLPLMTSPEAIPLLAQVGMD